MANVKSIELLDEGKIRIQGKIKPEANDPIEFRSETCFEIEVKVPPSQNLPEHFYLSLLRGDLAGAFSELSEESTYTVKIDQIVRCGCESNVDHESVDETKQGKISELEEEWEEIVRELGEDLTLWR
jgi:hypothetical protein